MSSYPDSFPLNYNPNDSINQIFAKLPYPLDDIDESIPIPNTKEESHSPIFRNKSFIKTNGLLNTPSPNIKTLFHLFEKNVQSFSNNNFLGKRVSQNGPYEFKTYKQVQKLRNQLGSGIIHLMNRSQLKFDGIRNDFILSIYAPNRYEWSLLDYACQAFSITSTALYDTLGIESINYILQITKTPILFTTSEKIFEILKLINRNGNGNNNYLKIVVCLDQLTTNELENLNNFTKNDVQIINFNHVLEIGEIHSYELIPPKPSTIFSITFTSGTSGIPKGVILSHGNIMASILTICSKLKIENSPKHFVFLPLAHILQRVNFFLVSLKGGSVFFPFNGNDTKTFFNDIIYCKPTHMASVPRVYNKLESIFKNKIYGINEDDGDHHDHHDHHDGIVNKLTKKAIEYKLDCFKKGINPNHWIYDLIIHKKLRSIIGFNNIQYFVSGAAPIHIETLNFIKAIFNVHLFFEAYGSTETCGGILMNSGFDLIPGTVGSISPTTEFRIKNLPEMNYTFEQNRSGELLVRGPQVFQGYYKNEEITKKSFDKDGWYMTGDVVKVDFKGKISIIDRLKNFFKLSQGEFIAPEKIENQYISNNSDLINQIWCYGDTLQSYLVGIIGVDLDNLKKFVRKNNLKFDVNQNPYILFQNIKFKKLFLKKINSNMNNLQGFEKLKNIYIDIEPLKIENDTLTPTLKVKRFIARKYFQNEIEHLYKQGPLFGNKL